MQHKFVHYTLLLLGIIPLIFLSACRCEPEPVQPELVIQWSRTFDARIISSVQQTKDGGYIVCGSKPFYETPNDAGVWLVKTDADGNTIWDKTFIGQEIDWGNSVQQTTDGGYIVCGDTWPAQETGQIDRPNVWLIKTDADGNMLWDKTFGGKLYHSGQSVQQTTDGGYIICGTGDSEVNVYTLGVLLIKTDADGNMLWEKVFEHGAGSSVQQTTDGGYIICGTADIGIRLDVPDHCWLIKTDADGNKIWEGVFGEGISLGSCRSVQQTADGGYITCGTIHYEQYNRTMLIKIPPEK